MKILGSYCRDGECYASYVVSNTAQLRYTATPSFTVATSYERACLCVCRYGHCETICAHARSYTDCASLVACASRHVIPTVLPRFLTGGCGCFQSAWRYRRRIQCIQRIRRICRIEPLLELYLLLAYHLSHISLIV